MKKWARRTTEDAAPLMTVGMHLEELRRRVLYGLLGIVGMCIFTLWYGRHILLYLCQPLFEAQRQLGLPCQAINLSVAGGFTVYLKIGLLAGVALGAPWVLFQLWTFLAPGMKGRERRFLLLLVPYSLAMTVVALLFMYYVFLPAATSFLLLFSANYPNPNNGAENNSSLRVVTTFFSKLNGSILPNAAPPGHVATQPTSAPGTVSSSRPRVIIPLYQQDPSGITEGEMWLNTNSGDLRVVKDGQVRVVQLATPSFMVPQIEINQYLDFVLFLAVILVLSFQLPVAMACATAVGILKPNWLRDHRKSLVFACFVTGVIITPNQDVVSNILFPLLLWGLFEIGLITSRILVRRNDTKGVTTQDMSPDGS
jgi:Sec-independent protein secretion pathway component TatC